MIKQLQILLLLVLWSCSQVGLHSNRVPASNSGVPTFGAELTFTSEKLKDAGRKAGSHIVNSDASERAQERLVKRIVELCNGCYVDWMEDKYGLEFGRIIYPDGHYINITLDPWVVEVTASPIPLDKLDEITARLNKDLYRSASDIGLHPSYNAGGGHIHLGMQSLFDGDAKLFRDFMVDLYNHPELASGILASDSYNSPPMMALPKKNQDAFKDIVREFDESPTSIHEFATRMYDEVYSTSVSGWDPPQKYQGVNISRLVEDFHPSEETIELRFIRPQQNADQFKLISTLFANRVEYLKSERAAGRVIETKSNPYISGLSSPNHAQFKFDSFMTFVEQSDLDPIDYLRLLGEEYTQRAATYLEKKFPKNKAKRIYFLTGLAQDSAYDQTGKAKYVLNELAKVEAITKDHEHIMAILVERGQESPDVMQKIKTMLKSHQLWSKTSLATKLKSANNPKKFRDSCLQFINQLLVPVPRSR